MQGTTAVVQPVSSDGFWDAYSRYYDSVYHLMPYRKLLWDTYQALDLAPGMRVLDAGCGTGNFEHFIAQKNPPAVRIDAVDASTAMLDVARAKCRDLPNVTFALGDLNGRLPFDDATFDRVLSINVLFALTDWDVTMAELLRVLKPEGRMALTSSLPAYKFGPLLADHVRRIGNIWGTRRKVRAVYDTLRVMATGGVGSAAMNIFVIARREAQGKHQSPDFQALNGFLQSHRAQGLATFDVGHAMANQNFFATATKSRAAEAS